MLSNQKPSRFYSVKGTAFTAIALALLMSVTAFASGNSRFAFIDSATEFFGLQSNTQTANSTQNASRAIVDVSVSLPNLSQAGGTVSFPITVGDTTGTGIISYDLNVDFDPTVMVPAGGGSCAANACFTQSGTLSSSMSVTPNVNFPGHFVISAFQAAPLAGPGTLLILNFTIVGTAGQSTALTFTDFTEPNPPNAFHAGFVWNEGDPVPNPLVNGSLSIPAATATNTNTPTPSSTSTNTATNTNTPTNTPTETGTATNTSTPTPTPLCAQIDMDDETVTTGSAVTISMTTTNTTPLTPQAFSVDTHVTYDPSMLALDTGFPGSQLGVTLGTVGSSNGSNMLVSNPSSGLLVISLFSTSAFSGAGSLVDIHFTALGAPGSFTPVFFTPWVVGPTFPSGDADGFKYNEGSPTTCLTDGSVTISGTATGVIEYGNEFGAPGNRHVPNTTVDGFGSPNVSDLSDSTGNYSMSGFGMGAYTIVPSRGSAVAPNTHGTSITAFDAARVQQNTVGVGIPFTPVQTFVANVTDADGVTSLDATAIATWVVSGPTNFYFTGDWRFAPASVNYAFVGAANDTFQGYLMGEVTGNWCDPLEFGPGLCNPFGFTTAGSRQAPGQRATAVAARSVKATTGSNVVVPVDVQGAGNKGIIAYQFDLKYDQSVIQPQANAVTLANTVSNGLYVVTNALTPGVLRVAVFGVAPISDSGVLLNFHFTAVGTAFDVSPLTFENFMFNEGGIRTNLVNGEVRLTPAVANTTAAD